MYWCLGIRNEPLNSCEGRLWQPSLKIIWIVVLRQRQDRKLYNSPSSESNQARLNCRVARENRKFSVENIKFTMKSLILAQDER